MSEEPPVDLDALRERFPWVGMAGFEGDFSARYREIMAESRRDRGIVEAIDAARRRP
ncbi:hypothetical protein [Actinopolymorpha cephalotaxi]|uniref:Uncharacterized protein n=1 Tax=Actinopolymorpha cephalotaxi TaxID=504797 RepID=A0ABX2SAX9_9ACTN|nr:hypothetical protein [Actinopolymorpha cephalotaxi]NYH86812.1 hypothetical protein [Actinopolymorpha cephalotaxi]